MSKSSNQSNQSINEEELRKVMEEALTQADKAARDACESFKVNSSKLNLPFNL